MECLRGHPFCPPIRRGDNLLLQKCMINSQQCWSSIASLLSVDPLTVDCWPLPTQDEVNSVDHWSPQGWPLTLSLLNVDCQSPHCWLSTLSLLTVDHRLPHCWLLTPLTVDCWSLITSLLTTDPLTVDCWSLITSLLTVNPPPLQIATL